MKRLIALALFVIVLAGCTTKKNYITNVNGPQDWQPPVLTWLTPPDSPLRGTVGLDVSVTDSSHVDSVTLFVDGRESATVIARPYRFEIHSDSLTDGVHICEARAWDQFGNLGISPVLRVFAANGTVEGIRLFWVPDDYPTIQAAINAATDFDTIRVRDGTYYETLNTFGKGVWIESEHGPLHSTISAGGLTNVFFVPPSQVRATIRGFRLEAAFNVIFVDDGAQIDLFNNVFISDTTSDSSYTFLFSGFSSVDVINNLFSGSRASVQTAAPMGTIENNIFLGASEYALWNRALSGNPIFHGFNTFWQNGHDYGGFAQGTGEFNADPGIDVASGQLLPRSPCIDFGDPGILDLDNTRSDIGPYGGPLAYR